MTHHTPVKVDTAAALRRDREPGEGDSEGRLQQEKTHNES